MFTFAMKESFSIDYIQAYQESKQLKLGQKYFKKGFQNSSLQEGRNAPRIFH